MDDTSLPISRILYLTLKDVGTRRLLPANSTFGSESDADYIYKHPSIKPEHFRVIIDQYGQFSLLNMSSGILLVDGEQIAEGQVGIVITGSIVIIGETSWNAKIIDDDKTVAETAPPPSQKLYFKTWCGLQMGSQAPQEDAIAFFPEKYTLGNALWLVTDGASSSLDGAYASLYAAQYVAHVAQKQKKLTPSDVKHIVENVSRDLYDQVKDYPEHPEINRYLYTTLSGVGVYISGVRNPLRWYVVHSGDSKVYYQPANTGILRQITEDHTEFWYYQQQGQEMTADGNSPSAHNLWYCLGLWSEREYVALYDDVTWQVQLGDRMLVCSDGLERDLGSLQADLSKYDNTEELIHFWLNSVSSKDDYFDDVAVILIEAVTEEAEQAEIIATQQNQQRIIANTVILEPTKNPPLPPVLRQEDTWWNSLMRWLRRSS